LTAGGEALRDFSQEGQKILIARRAIRRATQHQTRWRQREPPFLAFCPSDLPVKKSRSCEVAWIRQSSFCDSGCVLAAKDVWNPYKRVYRVPAMSVAAL
jgi:hypothetical protein